MPHFDHNKARTFLRYLSKAHRKFQERERARERVRESLKRLKKLSTKKMEKDLVVLEHRITEAIATEQKILTTQEKHEASHNDFLDKIEKLHSKLTRYLDTKDARRQRLKDLEKKIIKSVQPRKYQLMELIEELRNLERGYADAKSSGKYTAKELRPIERTIKNLKKRIDQLNADQR
jgi:chromosome segregation ATPase